MNPKTKYLILDFDGVLNSYPMRQSIYEGDERFSFVFENQHLVTLVDDSSIPRVEDNTLFVSLDMMTVQICPSRLDLVNEIVNETGANVVVSSTWRIFFSFDKVRLTDLLRDRGAKFDVVDCTPGIPLRWNGGRGSEIENWKRITPGEKKIVVLDDLPVSIHGVAAVKTNDYVGLTKKNVRHAIRMLNQ